MAGPISRLLAVLSLAAVLGACAAAVVGGGARGGYPAGAGDRPGGSAAADAAITSTINTRLVHDTNVSAMTVTVRTYRGTVTLTGSVGSAEASRRAVAIAYSVGGVVRVINRLTITQR